MLPIGHSVDGRTIRPVVLGSPAAAHRVLVVGCIHGNETAGIPIVQRLIATGAPAGTEIVAVTAANPDGCRLGTRQNAHGVDLNRNFPLGWRPLTGVYSSGPHALSEPESRIAYRLMVRLHPAISIWYHQHLDLVDESGGDVTVERRYAALVGLRALRMTRYPGSIVTWENARFRDGTAFVVELPAGEPSAASATRFARAVDTLAHPR